MKLETTPEVMSIVLTRPAAGPVHRDQFELNLQIKLAQVDHAVTSRMTFTSLSHYNTKISAYRGSPVSFT